MRRRPGLGGYIRAFGSHWLTFMSGSLTVPLAVIAFFVPSGVGQVLVAITAGVCFLYASYSIWNGERIKVVELESRLKPKLRASFDIHDTGCVRQETPINFLQEVNGELQQGTAVADWYRVKVETDSAEPVSGCRGRLLSIMKDGETIFSGEPVDLTFAPGEATLETFNKTIHNNAPEYLDFAYKVHHSGQILPSLHRAPGSVKWIEIFRHPGRYVFEIAILNPGETITVNPAVEWID